jgi:GTP1/Obg family GTP-binding protein
MPGIAADLAERRREADRQWELQRAAMRAAEERRRRTEDKQNIRQSVKDSGDQLSEIIKAWGDVRNLELFFEGVAAAVSTLSSEARDVTLSRLALAREFVGSQNPLDFFLDWKTPLERYQPRYDDAWSNVHAADEDE